MSSPDYRRHPVIERIGWIAIGAMLALAVAACGVGAALAIERLVTA